MLMIVLFFSYRIVPIFMVSSLTGHNLEQLQNFLNSIPLRQFNPELEEKQLQQPPEFQVRNIYVVINIPLNVLKK